LGLFLTHHWESAGRQQYLIRFFDVMRGTLMAAPSKLLPVI
jgi:hypothetical protein